MQMIDKIVTDTSDNRIKEECILYCITAILLFLVLINEIPTIDEMMFQVFIHQLFEHL